MKLRDMLRNPPVRDGYWFVPKRFGYGATPVTWQGWLVTFGFAASLLLALWLLPAVPEKIIVSLAMLAAMLRIAVIKTDGAWRWRSGG